MLEPVQIPPEGVPVKVKTVPTLQMVWSNPALTIGRGSTLTVVDFTLEQLVIVLVVVIEYTEVLVGLAIVDEVFVELKLNAGVQEYVFPPEAKRVTLLPKQIVDDGDTIKLGKGFTVTKTVSLALQPKVFVEVTI